MFILKVTHANHAVHSVTCVKTKFHKTRDTFSPLSVPHFTEGVM